MLPAAAFFITNSKPRFLAPFLQSGWRKTAGGRVCLQHCRIRDKTLAMNSLRVLVSITSLECILFVLFVQFSYFDQWKTKESKIRHVQFILFAAKWENNNGNSYSTFQPHSLPVKWRKERTITYLADDTKCRSGVSSTEAVAESLSQWATWRLRRWQRRFRVAVFFCRLWFSWAIFTLCLAMPQVSNQICVFFIET